MTPILYTFHIHLPDLSTSRKTWKLPSVSLALLWSLDAWCLSGCQERRSRRKICRRSWLHEAMVPTDRGGPSISTGSDVETDLQPKRKKDLCFACGLWRAQFWDMTSHIIQQYKERWHDIIWYGMSNLMISYGGRALRFCGTHMPWMKSFIMKCVFCMVFPMLLCCPWSKYLQ